MRPRLWPRGKKARQHDADAQLTPVDSTDAAETSAAETDDASVEEPGAYDARVYGGADSRGDDSVPSTGVVFQGFAPELIRSGSELTDSAVEADEESETVSSVGDAQVDAAADVATTIMDIIPEPDIDPERWDPEVCDAAPEDTADTDESWEPEPEPAPILAVNPSPQPNRRSASAPRHVAAEGPTLPIGEFGRHPGLLQPAAGGMEPSSEPAPPHVLYPVPSEPSPESPAEPNPAESYPSEPASQPSVEPSPAEPTATEPAAAEPTATEPAAAEPTAAADHTPIPDSETAEAPEDATAEKETPSMSQIDTFIQQMLSIEGATGAAIVDISTGMALATGGHPGFDLNVAAAGNSDVVRAKLRTITDLGIDDNIEDIMLTLGAAYHLITVLNQSDTEGLFIYLVLDRSRSNLALARHKVNQIAKLVQV